MNKIHFIWAVDKRNTGDWVVSPLNYYYHFWRQYSVITHDIGTVFWSEIYKDDIVIVGGGGMLDLCDEWNSTLNKLTDVCENVVVWGCGFNTHYDTKKPSVRLKMERFKLFAVRDYNHPEYEWLPCVTCKMPELDKNLPSARHTGVITHHENTIRGFKEYDRITNGCNIGEITDFIASSDVVISNSYHALYWTMLMGKSATLVDRFSTKFDGFKQKPLNPTQEQESPEEPQRYNLAEARSLNDQFFERVKQLVESKISVPDNSYTGIFLHKNLGGGGLYAPDSQKNNKPCREKTKKIAIVTHYGNNNHNVGALLQAYALQSVITDMGFECAIVSKKIRYIAENRRRRTGYALFEFLRRIFTYSPSVLVKKVIKKVTKNKASACDKITLNGLEKRRKLYTEFEDFIPHTQMYTSRTISEIHEKYDVFVTGSDVVFANALYNRDPYWLLAFAHGKPKLSYAASMEDWSQIEAYSTLDKRFFQNGLANFDGVSLRESGTAELFRSFGMRACHVLDPTLLKETEFYDALARPADIPMFHGEPFVLCYFVKESGYAKKKIADFCAASGYRMVLLPHLQGNFSPEDDKYKDCHVFAGPREFIWLIKNCRMMFGSSYHGTCLAILYHKPFFCFQPGLAKMKAGENFSQVICRTRLGSLLTQLGLVDRLFDLQDFPNKESIETDMDFVTVDEVITDKRQDSFDYLNGTIQKCVG